MGLISRVSSRTYRCEKTTMTARVVVLGGGISSLSFAYYLKQRMPKCAIQILESQNTVGGWLKTYQHQNNSLVELGPRNISAVHISGGGGPRGVASMNYNQLLIQLDLLNQLVPGVNIKNTKCFYDFASKKVSNPHTSKRNGLADLLET